MIDEWAAPGSAAEQPRPPVTEVVGGGSSPAAVGGRKPRPLPLRPQSVLEVIDSGFAIVRTRPALVLGVAAVFNMPIALGAAVFRRDYLDQDVSALFDDASIFSGAAPGAGPLALAAGMVVSSFVQTLVAVAVGLLISAWYADRDPSVGEVLSSMVRFLPVVAGAWILAHALQLLGVVAAGVGGFVVAVLTVLVAPVIAIEKVGPIDAIRRSISMVRSRFMPTAAFFLFSGLVASLMTALLTALPVLLAAQFAIPSGWVLAAFGSAVAGTVSVAVVASATVALYIDARVRLEGIDLQLLIADRFGS